MKARVLVVGLGDLGLRLASRLVSDREVGELLLASRDPHKNAAITQLLQRGNGSRLRALSLDALQKSEVEKLLRRERPDLIVQCASLLSPWYLAEREDPGAVAIRSAGFAAQLPAQLPIVQSVMEVVRQIGVSPPVVNFSYPDLTHPILQALGMAPIIGAGNVSMIWLRVRAALLQSHALVRVFAHHAHVTGCVRSEPPDGAVPRPRVFLGEQAKPADDLAYRSPPLPSDMSLNALSASSAVPVIRALLPGGKPVRISAPAPLGLPGGYPVLVANGRVELDLPSHMPVRQAVLFQEQCARMDGVERVASDGTVVFTPSFCARLRRIEPRLSEPLAPAEALSRFSLLKRVLNI